MVGMNDAQLVRFVSDLLEKKLSALRIELSSLIVASAQGDVSVRAVLNRHHLNIPRTPGEEDALTRAVERLVHELFQIRYGGVR